MRTVPPFSENIGNLVNDLHDPGIFDGLQYSDSESSNENYDTFIKVLTSLIDKYFPCKYVRYNKYKHKKLPWITTAMMNSIAYKVKLYIRLKATPPNSDNLQTNFRTYKIY